MASGATRQSSRFALPSRFGLRARWQPPTGAPVFGAREREAAPRRPRRPARACWPQYCIGLITGELGVGYVPQRFDDTAICTIDGPAWSALVIWRPALLPDVGCKAERLVIRTSDASATGVIANSFQKHLVGINATAQV